VLFVVFVSKMLKRVCSAIRENLKIVAECERVVGRKQLSVLGFTKFKFIPSNITVLTDAHYKLVAVMMLSFERRRWYW